MALDLAQLRNQAKKAESKWNMKYLAFDQRLREIEQELRLSPYARLSDVLVWGEKLMAYSQKLELMRQSTLTLSSEGWEELEKDVYSYQSKDNRAISVMSDYVSFLVSLDRKYSQRLDSFLNFLDNCIRYIRGYTRDLEENGLSLSLTIKKLQELSTISWLNEKSVH